MKTVLINKRTLSIIIFIVICRGFSFAQVSYSGTTVSGINPSAIGYQTKAQGNYTFSAGYMSEATDQTAIALGWQAKATGWKSIALGESCISYIQSYSFGQNAQARAQQSLAIGRFVQTDPVYGMGSIVLGTSTSGYVLNNNITNSLMVGFNSTQPTLFVGPAATTSGYGKVGIATKVPLQPLHVNGNILLTGTNSTLLFDDSPPTNGGWGKWGIEYETNGLNFWKPFDPGKSSDANYNPKSVTAFNYVLFLKDDGNIGIGTNTPLAMLHVEGTAKVMQSFSVGDSRFPASMIIYGPSVLEGTANVMKKFTVGEEPNPASMNIYGPSVLNGTLQVTTLQSGEASMIVADRDGILGTAPILVGDNLGNHIATQNLQMNGKFITNDESTSTSEGIFIGTTGDVGIKTSSNIDNDDLIIQDPLGGSSIRVLSLGTNPAIVWTQGGSKKLGLGVENGIGYLFDDATKLITIKQGKIGIGITDDLGLSGTHMLFVAGGITSEEVNVKFKENPWSDYVFDEKYKLLPLADVDKFIKQNKHLPEVPNQAEVQLNGIDLGSMNALLLKKIEELTLYVIEQEKRITELEKSK